MDRTIVVGDIHGCCDELDDLVRACGWSPGEHLVFVGDLVAKGPDSAGVLARAQEWGARSVLGNHDSHVLRIRAMQSGQLPPDDRPVKPEHQYVLDTVTAEQFDFLASLPLLLRLGPEHAGSPDTIVVHAGLVPGVPLEQQNREHVLNLRSIQDDGTPTKRLSGRPWASLWPGPERVVFGHDAMRGLQQHPCATGLDTGCVYGGRLTAILLPERRLISVPARRAYVKLER